MAALKNRQFERIAQLLATMKTPEQASAEAGFNTDTIAFAANARKRACRADIKARVAELQSTIAACGIVDAAWIRGKVAKIGGIDVDPDIIKASDVIAALGLLAKMTPDALVPQKVAPTNAAGDGPAEVNLNTTDEDRARALQAFLARTAIKGKA